MILTSILVSIALILVLLAVITAPISVAIANYFPDLNSSMIAVTDFLNVFTSNVFPWVRSLLGIPSWVIRLILVVYTFEITCYLSIKVIKVIIAWYRALKM